MACRPFYFGAVLICIMTGAMTVDAQAAALPSDVVEKVEQCEVNWSSRSISTVGRGVPPLGSTNIAFNRDTAERSAKTSGIAQFHKCVRALRVTGRITAAYAMERDPLIKAMVESTVGGYKTTETRFFSDGGVELTLQIVLDGQFIDAFVAPFRNLDTPTAKAETEGAAAPDEAEATGVIVTAHGIAVTPAFAPRLVDEKGADYFSARQVSRDAVYQNGIAGYSRSLDSAMKDPRIGNHPLIIRAQKPLLDSSADLVIAPEDRVKLLAAMNALQKGRVLIVVD